MTMDPASDIKIGLDVYTMDGEMIGTVKDLYEDYIKIDAPLQIDYWLVREHVQSFTGERVTLMFTKEQLDDHKQHEPEGYEERVA
jgi:hypothetical protein